MKDDHENLESLLHRQLRALPDLNAPRELIPNVLRRIGAQKTVPWWRRPWLEWPRIPRLLSGGLVAAVVEAVCFWRDGLLSLFSGWAGQISGASGFFHRAWIVAQTFCNVLEQLAVSLRFPWLAVGAGVLLSVYLGVIGVGAVFYQVLASQRVVSK